MNVLKAKIQEMEKSTKEIEKERDAYKLKYFENESSIQTLKEQNWEMSLQI